MWVVIGVIFSEQYQHSFGLGRAPAGAGSSGQGVCDGDRVLSAQTSYQHNVWAELFRWTSEYPMFVLDHVTRRYILPLYNAEAIHFQVLPNQVITPSSPLDNGGILFSPLHYDVQVKRLTRCAPNADCLSCLLRPFVPWSLRSVL